MEIKKKEDLILKGKRREGESKEGRSG